MNKLKILLLGFVFLALLAYVPNVYAEEGTIGEYDTLEEAEIVAAENEKDTDEEKVETSIVTEEREYVEDTKTLDETYDSELLATIASEAYKAAYILMNYEVESSSIEAVIVTETSTEERTFNSITEILTYRALLEAAGYDVSMRVTNLGISTENTNQTEIDKTFTSVVDLLSYLVSLVGDYNNFQIQFENNSYVVTTEEDIQRIFSNQIEAYAYALGLYATNDEVSNLEIFFTDQPIEERETIEGYYESEAAAEEAYNNLISPDSTLENKEIKELIDTEIEEAKDDIIDDLSLNNDEATYRSLSTTSTGVDVTFKNGSETVNATGVARVSEVIINGTSYNPGILTGIVIADVPNNSVVTVKGTITTNYCTRTIMGVCISYKTIDFESTGLLNVDRNNSLIPFDVLTDNVFIYNMISYSDVDGLVINDNLINVFKLTVDRVKTYTGPKYVLRAHLTNEVTVRQYRVFGTISKINIIPEYTLSIRRTRDVEKYHATVNMIKKAIKEVYIVNYVRTIKEKPTEDVTEPTTETPTKASIVQTSNPNTSDGLLSIIMLLLLSSTGFGLSIMKLRNN